MWEHYTRNSGKRRRSTRGHVRHTQWGHTATLIQKVVHWKHQDAIVFYIWIFVVTQCKRMMSWLTMLKWWKRFHAYTLSKFHWEQTQLLLLVFNLSYLTGCRKNKFYHQILSALDKSTECVIISLSIWVSYCQFTLYLAHKSSLHVSMSKQKQDLYNILF